MDKTFLIRGPEPMLYTGQTEFSMVLYNELKKTTNDQIAMIDAKTNRNISRQEFLEEVEKLVLGLLEIGINKGDVVVIISENMPEYIVTFTALIYLGVDIMLLNHDYTKSEVKHFLQMCCPKLICCSLKTFDTTLNLKNEFQYCIMILNNNKKSTQIEQIYNYVDVLINHTNGFKPVLVDNDKSTIILSSSGTTGLPKGVEITHSNLLSYLEWLGHPDYVALSKDHMVLNHLPLFHIFGLLVSIGSIVYGSKLVIMDKFHPQHFLQTIENEKITKLFTVPPVLQFLAKSPLVNKFDLSSLKDLLCGAASVKKEIENLVKERIQNCTIRQVYGLTETAAITIGPVNAIKPGSAGKVVVGLQVKICDPDTGKSLGPNQAGEICVKGKGITKRYLKNEIETRTSFDKDGFLKTGDLAYYDSEGYFFIVDRIKEIIKYKGFQVPPAELENLLINHPNIKDAGVIGVPDERTGEVALAFIVKEANSEISEEDIMQYVAENISIQKWLHGGVRFVDEIPKTASGKILRRKLKELL